METTTRRGHPALRWGALSLLLAGASLLGAIVALNLGEMGRDAEIRARSTTPLVVAVRDLARLESAEYVLERIIEITQRQRHLFGLVEASDALLLIAAGKVTAGIDLRELRDGDVTVVAAPDRRVTILLPRARVLRTYLDNDRTYVHHRDTDFLARREESLESRARRQAELALRETALEQGILHRAERNARATVEALVRSLGYPEVEVRFRSAPER